MHLQNKLWGVLLKWMGPLIERMEIIFFSDLHPSGLKKKNIDWLPIWKRGSVPISKLIGNQYFFFFLF